ncbi:Transposase [Polaromonas sp. OV174]|uniref:IS66-like element accessory protein TnpA n=1 Tax=Polaromonas sp. OV174 TaxID=1855300 RepID=UPI0008ED3276|nr:transposase [Polaromonas sp. OV174]SFC66198.1 Transposase [Polaromonas sp. OV174]
MMDQVSTVTRPRRREYSAEFKASVLDQCRQPGASVAGIALGYGINPNMVHRWMREARQSQMLADLQQGATAFVPLQLQPSPMVDADPWPTKLDAPLASQSVAAESIRIELTRAGGTVTVYWPLAAAAQCAQVLRDLLR